MVRHLFLFIGFFCSVDILFGSVLELGALAFVDWEAKNPVEVVNVGVGSFMVTRPWMLRLTFLRWLSIG